MIFDWFTALAQLVNFLILIALLRWLLYGRIKNAIRERQQKFDAVLAEAKQREEAADARAEEFREKSEQLERERKQKLEDARRQAEEKRDAWLKEAREETREQARRWKEQVRRERADLLRRLREKTAGEACAIAGKALRDLAGVTLEAQMVRRLRRQFDRMDDEARQQAVAALAGAARLRVATAFEIGRAHV